MRVLVVDDDPVLRRILRAGLTQAGHEVVEADDGQAAWELLRHDPIRLVITGWIMPRMDGPELIGRIRAADTAAYTYTILLTARDAQDDVVRGLAGGADDYLSKPFDPAELCARTAIGVRIIHLEERLRETRDQLEMLALHDSLTGLLNRRAIEEHAAAELQRAAREGTPLSLILLDIDHFKAVNDHHGHGAGDEALRLVAATLTGGTRRYQWTGRWGGEEFLLVLPRAGQPEAVAVAERLRLRIAATPLRLPDGGALTLRASLGVATAAPGDIYDLAALIHHADEALYRAKREGRDRVCVRPAQPDPAGVADRPGPDTMRQRAS